MEALAEELLSLTRTGNRELLLFSKLVHTQNSDDVLQVFVVLQKLLDAGSHAVVLFANDSRLKGARGGLQRVDGGVNTQLGDGTRQNGLRIQVGKRRGRRRGRSSRQRERKQPERT